MLPVIRQGGGYWVGWTGTDYSKPIDDSIRRWSYERGLTLQPVFLTAEESTCYYRGFSNEVIWPLFHGLPSRCKFSSLYWNAYRTANRKFADAVSRVAANSDLIWVHDYHLMILGQSLRDRGMKQRLAYFHHIPFPPADVFMALPWRLDVLRALLHFDVIGFQTARDRLNFITSVERCLPQFEVSGVGEKLRVQNGSQVCTVGTYPISIDYAEFSNRSGENSVAEAAKKIRKDVGETAIVLGVDRLDYTKGIPERLLAFRRLLETHPMWQGRVSLMQIVVPSREDIGEYSELRVEIERLVSNINGRHSTPGWVPIHYYYRSVPFQDLLAFYRSADVTTATPLRDGMNLVAKEFCASRVDERGVLVLSEFAGAADELRHGALIVNPHDIQNMADTLHEALRMPEQDQATRMQTLRAQIRSHDVFHWSRLFQATAAHQRSSQEDLVGRPVGRLQFNAGSGWDGIKARQS